MIKITKFKLKNGLRVVHHHDVSSPMVILNILYDIGSKDENPDQTGLAHLFEHLMFEGSVNIPSYDHPVQLAGGENNAWTSNDMTNYYVILPHQNVEIGFWLESDRMLSLDFNEQSLDVQKNVVMEEFKQRNLNQPYGDVQHLIRGMAYQMHPYRWPTIGKELSHIENVTLDNAKQFFFSHYAPNNAILAVVGNISPEETERLAEKWFGNIPARNINKRKLPQEPTQTEARFMEVKRDVPIDAIYKVFHTDARRDPGYPVSDILSDILSNGRSTRLYQRLVKEKKLFVETNAYLSGDIETGLFYVTGKLSKGITFAEAEAGIDEELKLLKTESVGDEELEKIKNKYESGQLFGELNLLDKASNMAYFELLGDADKMNYEIENYRKITSKQIQEKAGEIFRKENSSTLYYAAI